MLREALLNRDYSKQEKIHKKEFMKLSKYLSNDPQYSTFGFTEDFENNMLKWQKIPILTKSKIQKDGLREFYVKNRQKTSKLVYTGGSTTGQPVMFIEDKRSGDFSRAYFYLALYRYGWNLSKPWIKLWGRPEMNKSFFSIIQKKFSYKLQNCMPINAFDMSEIMFNNLYNLLKSKSYSHIYGYVNAIVEFAKFLEANELKVNIGFILTTAEMLTNDNQIFLNKIFDCPVYNGYACTEINSVAYSFAKLNFFRINTERVFVEIVGDNDEVLANGSSGRVILTDLQKRSFPLVRYDTGDVASMFCRENKCGEKEYFLSNLEGRIADVIRIGNGKIIHSTVIQFVLAEFFASLKVNLLKFQVIQTVNKKLIFKLDLNGRLNEDEKNKLKNKIILEIQENNILIDYTDKFLYGKSGKIRYFIKEEE